MKKTVGSFVALNRKAFLLLGVMLSLAVFGVVALQSRAQTQEANPSGGADAMEHRVRDNARRSLKTPMP